MAIIIGNDPVYIARKTAAPPFVTSSLLSHLDAGNTSSYPGTGDAWYDLSGNSRSGILFNGITYSSSNNGYLTFDGVDDYVTVGSGNQIDSAAGFNFASGQPFSFSMWIRPTNWGAEANRGKLIWRVNGALSASFQGYYGGIGNATGMLGSNTVTSGVYFSIINNPAGTSSFVSFNNCISLNSWQNLAFSYDGVSVIKIYKNGQELVRASGCTPPPSVSQKLYVSRPSSGYYYTGDVSQIACYTKELTASEVVQNFNALKSRYS